MEFEWWHWASVGILLILSELVVPGFVLIWFGAGALLVALLVTIVSPEIAVQLIVWLITSLILVALWFRVFKPEQHKTRIGLSDAAIGEIGLLSREVAPMTKGEVRFQRPILGEDVWQCVADETIVAGERVRVLAVEGSFLKIGRVSS